MNSSEETCLLCLSTNKNMIKFYSETAKELNVVSILSTHFWFQLDEIKVLSQNICQKCWKQTESFHEFYQSVRAVHKKFETVFVKIENDPTVAEDDGEILQQNIITDIKVENDLEIEDDQDADDDESLHEIPCTNSIDTDIAVFDTMSKQNQTKYLSTYDKFMAWKTGQNIEQECFSEAVLLEYFYYLQSKYKPSSLWVFFSMLKTTILKKHNIDIGYPEILSLLKKSSAGYNSETYKVFQPDELRRFLSEADDIKYLAVKVITIFGIYGANRTAVLTKVNVSDVTEEGSVFVIRIPEPKTNVMRSFTLENEYATYVRKYIELRPKNLHFNRFFLTYHNGQCRKQPIGKSKFTDAPKTIANFLKLKDAESYTLQSFRKKSKRLERNHSRRLNEAATSSVESTSTDQTSANKIGDVSAFVALSENYQKKYMRSYNNLMAFKTGKKIDKECFSEEVLVDYFNYMKTRYKPNSLWVEYSKLKATIQHHHSIVISYPGLLSSLKLNSVLCNAQKAYIFQPDEMRRFLDQAPDSKYLDVKVVMIFGMHGTSGGLSLKNFDVDDVSVQGSVVVIKLPERRTDDPLSITLDNEYAACVRKYAKLRPENTPHKRFFLTYHNGKCKRQPMGKIKFQDAPKAVAKFLKLKDAKNYTFHSFREKSKRCGKKRSSSVVNKYIEECIPIKKQIDDQIPVTINKISKDTTALELLPGKSKEKYIRSYENFLVWKTNENIDKNCFSEQVMLEYFNVLKPKYKPSSLWTEYSMLRTTIQKNDNIDIGYPKLKSFMRDVSVGFQSQKSKAFRPDEIRRFLSKADDSKFLVAKVSAIFGMYASISSEDLIKVEVKDVTEEGSTTVLKVPDKKTKGVRSFTLDNEYAAYVQKYIKLRPKDTPHNRFFLNFQNGKCTVQPTGKNKIMFTPKIIAKFLHLENAENYRWNSFSKTLSMDDGNGGLSSSSVAYDSTEEESANDGKINDVTSEQTYFKRSSEAIVTSTITNSMDTPAAASFQTAFQAYNFQPHQVPSLHYMQSGQRPAMDGMGISTAGTSNIPTAFQSYHVPPHQVQSYPLQYGGLNMTPNNGYGTR